MVQKNKKRSKENLLHITLSGKSNMKYIEKFERGRTYVIFYANRQIINCTSMSISTVWETLTELSKFGFIKITRFEQKDSERQGKTLKRANP